VSRQDDSFVLVSLVNHSSVAECLCLYCTVTGLYKITQHFLSIKTYTQSCY